MLSELFFINDGKFDIGVYVYPLNTPIFIKCQYQDVLMYCVEAVDLRCFNIVVMRNNTNFPRYSKTKIDSHMLKGSSDG